MGYNSNSKSDYASKRENDKKSKYDERPEMSKSKYFNNFDKKH